MSTADTLYPAVGRHIRGEMGGVWTPPIKLVDGVWFRVADRWLGDPAGSPATETRVGWGYTRTFFEPVGAVTVNRIDFVPDGTRALLVGLTFVATQTLTVPLALDVHSELMGAFPWDSTTPSAATFNLQDTGALDQDALLFRETGTPPFPNALPHDWAALVGGDHPPDSYLLGPDHRGPQDPAVVCPAEGPAPPRCDDSASGKGTGGQLGWQVELKVNQPTTLWFAVAGSDKGVTAARRELRKALADPAGALARKVEFRKEIAAKTEVDLPGDRLLEQSIAWSKQNLADSVQEVHDLALRSVRQGREYPAPRGTLAKSRWLGAGWPDYPWLFATDGEYTAFASVAMGQFSEIEAHLRALRDVSQVINGTSGKVVHEVMPDGSVYNGTLDSEGNTDETAKFPSAVALVWRWTGDDAFRDDLYDFTVRNMHYVIDQLVKDGGVWPEGLGNVEQTGMGVKKLDNTVYTIRGLRDLADLARSKSDTVTQAWAADRAEALESAFENAWWYGGETRQYADSVDDPLEPAHNNIKIMQGHWTGVTPMDAELVRDGQVVRPLASDRHGPEALCQREQAGYSSELGLFHTGSRPPSAEDGSGNQKPWGANASSTEQGARSIFSLNTAIMAVAEGNFGRLGVDQQQRYTTGNARIQLDPAIWEMPGAMPELAPGPDAEAAIDRPLHDRSMVLQAWGTYGTLWPVVHQQLGISPDLGRDHITVVPQVPDGQSTVAGRNIQLGNGSVDVVAERRGSTLMTTVTRNLSATLVVGHVLPVGRVVSSVTLNGAPATYRLRSTARGNDVVVDAGKGSGTSALVVALVEAG